MENLTKENFWNGLYESYPVEMKRFCDWVDEYKLRVHWSDLFGNINFKRKHYWADIKFHHLPIAMQIGIFIQYVYENKNEYGLEIGKIRSMYEFNDIPEIINDFFLLIRSIEKDTES
jgi:hypothetical protein